MFYPAEVEFKDFKAYIEHIEGLVPDMGICKIVPPSSWVVKEYDIEEMDITVTNAIKQVIGPGEGVYSVNMFLNPRSLSMAAFQAEAVADGCADPHEERESKFWEFMAAPSGHYSPLYGADLPGSLFTGDEPHPAWNLSKLDNLLNLLGKPIPGVNTSMLYVGSWRAMFAFHVEDKDLYSINYLHYGEPKQWYSIPPSRRRKFESFMRNGVFADQFKQCREYLRHKTCMVAPSTLQANHIHYKTALQQQGEIIVTFPGAYHAGFNHGFNIAEAVNFATERWFAIGLRANHCRCRKDSVMIDVEVLEATYLRRSGKASASAGRLRCICNRHASSAVKGKEAIANTPTVTCTLCGLMYHPACIRAEYLLSYPGYDLAFLDRKCHICDAIDFHAALKGRQLQPQQRALPGQLTTSPDKGKADAVRTKRKYTRRADKISTTPNSIEGTTQAAAGHIAPVHTKVMPICTSFNVGLPQPLTPFRECRMTEERELLLLQQQAVCRKREKQ